MIPLSLFMLDPVEAHARYMEEVAHYEDRLKKKEISHKDLKREYLLLKEKMRKIKSELSVVQNKLAEERKK